MKSVLVLFFVVLLFYAGTAVPVQPRYERDTLHKKNKNFADRFKFKKQKKVKKTQDVGCWICEPLHYASDTFKKAYTPRHNDPCSAFVWLLLLPVIILIAVIVAIYAAIIIGLILLLGSAILFGLYALLLFSMGIALAGWYIWGGIIGAIVVFTVFYFTFCRLCR
jgi:hypothetical protein